MMVRKSGDSQSSKEAAALQAASQRLGKALDRLASRSGALLKLVSQARESGEVDADRSRLAADLDQAQARADALEQAAQEAGAALDSAIAQVRQALAEE